jgi:hypothetical protein
LQSTAVANDVSTVHSGQQSGDKFSPSFCREKLRCLEFGHLHRMVCARLAYDFDGFSVADCDGAKSKHPLILLEKVRSGMPGFVTRNVQNL